MENIIYSYWNASLINDVLNAVVLVTGGANEGAFQKVAHSVALIAFLVAAGTGLARLRGNDMVMALFGLGFFYGVLFLPKTTAYIVDVRTGFNYSVDNVPYGLVVFGATTSHIGKWLTETYETNFTSVEDEKFSKTGMVFGQRLVEGMVTNEITEPRIVENTQVFTRDCINPEFLDNLAMLNKLTKAKNAWKFINGTDGGGFSVNPGRITSYTNHVGINFMTDCQSALILNGEDVVGDETATDDSLITKWLDQLGIKLEPNDPTPEATIRGQLPTFNTSILTASQTAQEIAAHYVTINLLRHASENSTGIIAATLAAQASESSYATMKMIAEGALPKLRNLIEALVYSVFPIIILLIIAAGQKGGKVAGTYLMTMVWVQLWAPLYAIINSFSSTNFANAALKVTASDGGATIGNMTTLLSMSVSEQAMAGLLTISVPAIALALVKGGEMAMSGVVSSLMSPAQSMAAKMGGEAGLGSYSGGQVQWGNVNMQNSTVGNTSAGNIGIGTTQVGGSTLSNRNSLNSPTGTTSKNQDGSTAAYQHMNSDAGVNANLSKAVAGISRQEEGKKLEAGLTSSQQAGIQQAATLSALKEYGAEHKKGSGGQWSSSYEHGSDVAQAAQRMESAKSEIQSKFGVSDKQAAAIQGMIGAGASSDSIAKVIRGFQSQNSAGGKSSLGDIPSAKIGADAISKSEAAISNDIHNIRSSGSMASYSDDAKTIDRAVESSNKWTDSNDKQKKAHSALKSEYASKVSSESSARSSLAESQIWGATAAQFEQGGGSISTTLGDKFVKALVRDGYIGGPEGDKKYHEMLANNPAAVQAYAEKELKPEIEQMAQASFANGQAAASAQTPSMRAAAAEVASGNDSHAKSSFKSPRVQQSENDGQVGKMQNAAGLNAGGQLPSHRAPTTPGQVTKGASAISGRARTQRSENEAGINVERSSQKNQLLRDASATAGGEDAALAGLAVTGIQNNSSPGQSSKAMTPAAPTARSVGSSSSPSSANGVTSTHSVPAPAVHSTPAPQSTPAAPKPVAKPQGFFEQAKEFFIEHSGMRDTAGQFQKPIGEMKWSTQPQTMKEFNATVGTSPADRWENNIKGTAKENYLEREPVGKR
jgi:conjugal transfer mating pair stabilization protein TraG